MTTTASGANGATGIATKDVVDWTDLGKEMWSYLTGKGAAIDYTFVDMTVEVPRDTGANAPTKTAPALRTRPAHSAASRVWISRCSAA